MAEIIAHLVSSGNNVIVKLIKLGWNGKEELRELKQNLELIECYLRDAQTKQSVKVVEHWLQNLESDYVHARQELVKLEKKVDRIAKWNCEGVIPAVMSAADHAKIGYEVKNLNQKLRKTMNWGTDLGLQSRVNLVSSFSSFFKKIWRWLWR